MNINFKNVSNESLLANTKALAREERRITIEVLHHLREIERRRAYAERGYATLFDYATQELGYSSSSASRRINSMKALKDMPELESAIEEGKLSITTVAQVQTFLRQEKFQNQKT